MLSLCVRWLCCAFPCCPHCVFVLFAGAMYHVSVQRFFLYCFCFCCFFSCCCCCYIVVGFLLSFSPCVFRVIVLHIFLPFNFFPKKTTCCAPPHAQMNLMLSQPKCEDPRIAHIEDPLHTQITISLTFKFMKTF